MSIKLFLERFHGTLSHCHSLQLAGLSLRKLQLLLFSESVLSVFNCLFHKHAHWWHSFSWGDRWVGLHLLFSELISLIVIIISRWPIDSIHRLLLSYSVIEAGCVRIRWGVSLIKSSIIALFLKVIWQQHRWGILIDITLGKTHGGHWALTDGWNCELLLLDDRSRWHLLLFFYVISGHHHFIVTISLYIWWISDSIHVTRCFIIILWWYRCNTTAVNISGRCIKVELLCRVIQVLLIRVCGLKHPY